MVVVVVVVFHLVQVLDIRLGRERSSMLTYFVYVVK